MDASWLEILVIAYAAAGLRTGCDGLMGLMCPQTPAETKSALFIRAMQAGIPASCQSAFLIGVWASFIILYTIKWPYDLARSLWHASGVVVSTADLHRQLRAWDAYEGVLTAPPDPATEETRQMPVVPMPRSPFDEQPPGPPQDPTG